MSDVIRLLPDAVANQIAAGEVVQRPASVVKELLENAIDAHATHIQLVAKDAGRTLIQVIDNGIGMSITDARMAFERHATSKIYKTEDIFSIETKGFRGEALASIAAVAQVLLKTKKTEEETGTQITIEGGSFISQQAVVCSQGSNFSVKNLFYNVPARRKFLKSNAVEFRHILDEFYRVVLAHSEISFTLTNNDEIIFQLKKSSLAQRIVGLFGSKIQSYLLPISEHTDWISIDGFIGNLDMAKKSRTEQFFFVNNRFFKSYYLNKAINDAYEDLLPTKHFPSFFIYITIKSELIDVNIHPTKTEVKFEDESAIYALIRSATKKALGIYSITPVLDFEKNHDWSIPNSVNPSIQIPKINVNPDYNPFKVDNMQIKNKEQQQNLIEIYAESIEIESKVNQEVLFDKTYKLHRMEDGLWLWKNKNILYFLDFYRIQQTLLHKTLEQTIDGNILSQQLLFSWEYPIHGANYHKLKSVENQFHELGFELEIDKDMVTFHALPSYMLQEYINATFDELLADFDTWESVGFHRLFKEKTLLTQCITKNFITQQEQVEPWLKAFEEMNLPLYNPYGKSNYYALPYNTIQKELL